MFEITDVWCGNIVDVGEFVTDGRLLFKRKDAEPELLGKLLEKIGVSKAVRPLKTQDHCRQLWRHYRKEATYRLYFIKEEKKRFDTMMLFIDIKKRPTRIDKCFFMLAKKLLNFDTLKARKGEGENTEAIVLYRGKKAVGLLMPLSAGMDLPDDLTVRGWPES